MSVLRLNHCSDTTSDTKLINKCDVTSNLDKRRAKKSDYQRIAIENNVFENNFFEIILKDQ